MAYAAGVDVGSTQTKAVIVDEKGKIIGRTLIDTGSNVVTAAEKSFLAALAAGGISESEVGYVVGTGYGRYKVTFGDTQITEISCHRAEPRTCFRALEPCSTWVVRTPKRFA
jgi:activator of 2-hydroxyglutaryl-CoA dehydratase